MPSLVLVLLDTSSHSKSLWALRDIHAACQIHGTMKSERFFWERGGGRGKGAEIQVPHAWFMV